MKNRRATVRSDSAPLRLSWRRLLAAGALALSVVGAYGLAQMAPFVTSHPYFTLTEIRVDGNRRLERQQVLEWAQLQQGMSSWDAAPDTIQANLLRNPWIREAEVERHLPNGLSIAIAERRPAAIVRLDQLYYVDRQGRILGPLGAHDSRDFPIIGGFNGSETRNYAAAGIRHGLRLLRLCGRESLFEHVSEISVDREHGPTLYPATPAVGVRLGWGNWRQKLSRSLRVLKAWEGKTEELHLIDLSFRNRAVVKLKPVPAQAHNQPRGKGTRI